MELKQPPTPSVRQATTPLARLSGREVSISVTNCTNFSVLVPDCQLILIFAATASNATGFGTSGGLFSTGGGNQTSLFGGNQQQQQQQQQNSSFSFGGGTTGASNSFGAATNFGSTFGSTVVAAQEGTGHTKFQATTSTDTMMKAGQSQQISTRHQCITCMKEYENKSMEELRCEDYIAGRKGGGAMAASGSMFGQAAPTTGTVGGLFGQQQQPTSSSGGWEEHFSGKFY